MQTINDLFDYNLKIIQNDLNFKFSLDSILLAEFIDLENVNKIVDFCTGNAVIPLILSTKTKAKIYGIEYQKQIYDYALKSIKINNLNNQINIINADVKNINNLSNLAKPDIIVCNPPYFKYQQNSLINQNIAKTIARHEILIDLEDIIKQASNFLQTKKSFYLVHRSNRLDEIIILCHKYNLNVKKICFVFTKKNQIQPLLVLIKAVKNSHPGVKITNINISEYTTYQNIFKEEKK